MIIAKEKEMGKWTKCLFFGCLGCLSVYLSYVVYFSNSSFLCSTSETVFSVLFFLLFAAGLFGGLLAACRFFLRKGFEIRMSEQKLDPGFFAAAFFTAMAVLFTMQYVYGPWLSSIDTHIQWEQVLTGSYDNWHPVFHTLLLLVIHRIFGEYVWIIICQIVAFSAAYAYLLTTVKACGVPAWLLLITEVFVCFSKLVSIVMCYAMKDNSMTIGVLLLGGFCVQIIRTRGKWLHYPLRILVLGGMLAFTTLVRKNAFLFTVVLLVVLLFAFRKCWKQILCAACIMAALIGVIRGPLYTRLEVSYPDNTMIESIGVPMTILCDAKATAAEKLDEETNAFMDLLLPPEKWQQYQLHNYNIAKWSMERSPVECGLTTEKLFRMLTSTVLSAPRESFEAINGLTDLVWGVGNRLEATEMLVPPQMEGEGIKQTAQRAINDIRRVLEKTPLGWLTENIGPSLAGLLICALFAMYLRGPETLLLALPALMYDLGTTLLLSGNDGRFFQFSPVLSLTLILLLIPRRTKG